MNKSHLTTTTLKSTRSLCPVCRVELPAEVREQGGKIYLHKTCPQHGAFRVLINSDARFYYLSKGSNAPTGCGCGPQGCGADATPVNSAERSSTCIALIEIVESCDLQCPACYAASPFSGPKPEHAKHLSREEIQRRVQAVIARKGKLDILQLSGGEPTLHPQFFEVLEDALRNPQIGYVLLNTNGVRLAREAGFSARLGALRKQYKRFELYLQFDGTGRAGQEELRGTDLRPLRQQALQNAETADVPVTLAMAVTLSNCADLGATLRFGLEHAGVRGITFQPAFRSGRAPQDWLANGAGAHAVPDALNAADILTGLIEQSGGLLGPRDFTPLPCGDPNCHIIGYLLRHGAQALPVSRCIDFSQVQGFLKDRVNFNWSDLEKCGCESEPLGAILRALETGAPTEPAARFDHSGPGKVFRLFIKPFMDAWSYDQDRIDRCCVHVIGPDGALDSFCRHYAQRS